MMNNQIKLLAEQATTIEYGVDNGFDRVTFDKEKFAELIVKECMNICTTSYRTDDGWGVTGGDVRCHYAIADHFGFETNTGYQK